MGFTCCLPTELQLAIYKAAKKDSFERFCGDLLRAASRSQISLNIIFYGYNGRVVKEIKVNGNGISFVPVSEEREFMEDLYHSLREEVSRYVSVIEREK